VHHIAIAAAAVKSCLQFLLVLLRCSLKIESLRSFRKQMCGAPSSKPLCSCLGGGFLGLGLEGVPLPSPHVIERGSTTGDCDHSFSNKKFEKGVLVTFCALSF